jgi:hypothetical protein
MSNEGNFSGGSRAFPRAPEQKSPASLPGFLTSS